jgi:G3E family GTPase
MSEVNVDASLVDRSASNAGAALSRTDERLVEMSNGCSCCTLREDLLVEVGPAMLSAAPPEAAAAAMLARLGRASGG